jgi:hypothetical protein
MISMVIWVLALAASVCGVCIAVAMEAQTAHLIATAAASFAMVAAAVHEHKAADLAVTSPYSLAAMASRYMGLLWCWNAITTYVAYAFVLDWPYAMSVVLGMFAACGACMIVALVLDREAKSPAPDQRTLLLAATLAKVQFAFAAVLLGAMVAARQAAEVELGGAHRWVALNVILCTAAALLTLTGYLIMNGRAPADSKSGVATPAAG